MSWFVRQYPDLAEVLYGNATANIFTSQGLAKKPLPKRALQVLQYRKGYEKIRTWGPLLQKGIQALKLSLDVGKIDKDMEGAKFYQMNRTKELGAKASWPDLQVTTVRSVSIHTGEEIFEKRTFGSLFVELKDPQAGNLPFGKGGRGDLSTTDHLQKQAIQLHELSRQGHLGIFAYGEEEFRIIANMYVNGHDLEDLDRTYIEIQEFRDKFTKADRWLYRLRRK